MDYTEAPKHVYIWCIEGTIMKVFYDREAAYDIEEDRGGYVVCSMVEEPNEA